MFSLVPPVRLSEDVLLSDFPVDSVGSVSSFDRVAV